MNRRRAPLLTVIILAVLAAILYWSPGGTPAGFATPAECLDAYAEASLAGDVEKYLDCLAEPLRSEVRQRYRDPEEMAELLQQQMKEVKSWTQQPQEETETTAVVEVDETRLDGTRRVRYRLEQTRRGWLITAIGPPEEVPTSIRYGTHISETPE